MSSMELEDFCCSLQLTKVQNVKYKNRVIFIFFLYKNEGGFHKQTQKGKFYIFLYKKRRGAGGESTFGAPLLDAT